MGSKGSQQTTKNTTSTFTPAAQTSRTAGAAENYLQQALAQPYSNMPMQPVAGFSPLQQQAFGAIQQAQGAQAPAFDLAKYMAAASGTPIDMGQVNALYSQMADPVFKSMQDLFGQQMKQTTGNDITAAGGVGASRIPVAQANLAKQQQLAAGQTGTSLLQNAINTYMAQKQAQLSGGIGLGNLAGAAQGANYQDISSLLGGGQLQQQLAQQQMNAPYQWLLGQFQYPSALAGLGAGFTSQLAPALGGTTTGQEVTTAPAPSVLGQLAGLAMSGTGMIGATGGFGNQGWLKSIFPTAATGGRIEDEDNPYAGLPGYQEGGDIDPFTFDDRFNAGAFQQGKTATDQDYFDWRYGGDDAFPPMTIGREGALPRSTRVAGPLPASESSVPRDAQGNVVGGITGGLPYAFVDNPPVDQGPPLPVSADVPPIIRQGAPRPPLPSPDEQQPLSIAGLGSTFQKPDIPSRYAANPWLALMQAGFGTMAAGSKPGSTFLGSLGAGGIQGVKTLQEQRAEDLAERKFAESTRQHDRPYDEMTAAQRAADDRHKAELDERIRAAQRPYDEMTVYQQAQVDEVRRQRDIQERTAALAEGKPVDIGTDPDTGLPIKAVPDGQGGFKVIDPRTGKTLTPEEAAARGITLGGLNPEALNAAAERYLETGTLPPNIGRGVQGNAERKAIQNAAAKLAEERGIDPKDLPGRWQDFRAKQVGKQRFLSGPQGNTIRSLNVVVDHLSTMEQLADALKNGNIPLFNSLAQKFAEQTGQPAPTNFDAAKRIVGAEIIKSLGVAGAGTKEERKEAGDSFNRARSPDQLHGAIVTVQKLLTGQLKGLRQQFKVATGYTDETFNEMLLPETRKYFEGTEKKKEERKQIGDKWYVKRDGKWYAE